MYESGQYFENPEFHSPRTGGYHGYKQYMADREHIEEKFDRVLADIECFHAPGRLLDVGAGPGFLLTAAGRRGWDAAGVDLNQWAVDQGRAEGLNLNAVNLIDARFENGAFDAVTMMDLLEHVSDPAALVAEAARITRPGGVMGVLTPDAGSPVSRVLGARWPELQRVPEHLTLFSVRGLTALLECHGFEVIGWHWLGKRTTILTLISDVSPVAPEVGRRLHRWAQARPAGMRVYDLNPYTKFCLYARRREATAAPPGPTSRPLRLPRRRPPVESVEERIFEDLQLLARATGLCDWMFDQYRHLVRGRVLEVGGGIGTFTQRLLEGGAVEVLALEPEAACAAFLRRRFDAEPRVAVVEEDVLGSAVLARQSGSFNLVVCQNVLEHIDDDAAAVAAMAATLAPGGHLVVLVPAHPRLFGALDQGYGHHRRYTRDGLRAIARDAGLEVEDLYHFNMLGIPGWWVKSRSPSSRVTPGSMAVYAALLRAWRPLEARRRPPYGLSLVLVARRQ